MTNPFKNFHWTDLIILVIIIIFITSSAYLGIFAYHIFLEIGQEDSQTINRFFLNKWDWLAFGVSFVSLAFSFATAWSQWKTQRNTQKITPKSQQKLLLDYVRHFYMNLIVIIALKEKLKGKLSTHYPSEEHLLKLKVDLTTLNPTVFINNIELYQIICNLQVLFRNFNSEIDVAVAHFTNPNLPTEVKERDLNTLEFKMGYFTKKIHDALNELFGKSDSHREEMLNVIDKALKDRNSKGKDNNLLTKGENFFETNPLILPALPKEMQDTLYIDPDEQKYIDTHLKAINAHAYVELHGINSSGSEKIYLIPFQSPGYRL